MNRDEDRELRRRADREAERALFEHREQLQPPAGSAERSWAALQRRIAAGEAAPVLAEPVRAGGGRRVVIAVLAAAAVLALWLWRPQALRRSEAAGAVEAVLMRVDPDGSRRAAWAAKGGAGEAGSGDRSGAGTGGAEAGSGDRSAGSGDRSGAAGSGDRSAGSGDRSGAAGGAVLKDKSTGDLAVELAQVRAAGEAVRAGRGEEALAAAEAYLREHPLGAFAPEARLHQAEALCLLGREAAARAAAEAFLRELPDSPLRARVAGVCAAAK